VHFTAFVAVHAFHPLPVLIKLYCLDWLRMVAAWVSAAHWLLQLDYPSYFTMPLLLRYTAAPARFLDSR